jgi:hypothetical protein
MSLPHRSLRERGENHLADPPRIAAHAELALTDVESFRVVHRIAPARTRESEDQPQRIGDFVYAFKNFSRLQQTSFEKSIGIRLHQGEEFPSPTERREGQTEHRRGDRTVGEIPQRRFVERPKVTASAMAASSCGLDHLVRIR